MDISEIIKLIEKDSLKEALIEISALTFNLSAGLKIESSILQSSFSTYENKIITNTATHLEFAQIRLEAYMLIYKITELTDKGQIQTSIQDTLVMNNCFPFLDRVRFRKIIKDILESNMAKMIFVKGDPKSGMSYLEKYLIHLGEKNKIFQIYSIEIPPCLDDPKPYKGVRLAKKIADKVGLELNLGGDDEDLDKFVRLMTKLRESLTKHTRIPIFFLHDFHKMTIIPDDLKNFIYNMALEIRNNFPKSIFIIAGLDYEALPNWHYELRPVSAIYSLESVEEVTIIDCLDCIYDKFQEKVFQLGNGHLSKSEYIDGMISILIPNKQKIDLVFVGSKIIDHLIELNSI